MKTHAIELEWDSDPAALQEAMVLAGKHLFRGKRGLWILLNVVLMLLVSLGGAGLAILVSLYGWDTRDPGFPAMLVGSGLGVALLSLYQRWPIAIYAHHAAGSPYGKSRQRAVADARGITFANATTQWRSDWGAVASLGTGKKGLSVGVSGIAFSIPLAAFESTQTMQAAAEQMRVWQEGARHDGQQDGT